jgi:hypothetical protein
MGRQPIEDNGRREGERDKATITKTCVMLVSSFVKRTFSSFGRRMIVSVTVCERECNRGNPALLSSNSILAAVTTSLFSSVSFFSSPVLSAITIAPIAYAIE